MTQNHYISEKLNVGELTFIFLWPLYAWLPGDIISKVGKFAIYPLSCKFAIYPLSWNHIEHVFSP